MSANTLVKYKILVLYGLSLAIVLYLLQWLHVRLIILDHAFEIYIGSIAFIFTALGIWLGLRLTRPKTETIIIEKEVSAAQPLANTTTQFPETNLTPRELEVLQLMAEGLSNQEIAQRLFLSLSTIKTHSNNLFDKLEVKRRTQAVDKGRKLGIVR